MFALPAWGTPVTHLPVWAAHLSVWSTVLLQMVGGCYVMSLERCFLVGCWKEGKPQPCSRRRLWNFVRVNGVNQHPLSLRLATEDNLRTPEKSFTQQEIEKNQVCGVVNGEERAVVHFLQSRWLSLGPCFHHIIGHYLKIIDYLTFAFLWVSIWEW